jgi:hypothetical protein
MLREDGIFYFGPDWAINETTEHLLEYEKDKFREKRELYENFMRTL